MMVDPLFPDPWEGDRDYLNRLIRGETTTDESNYVIATTPSKSMAVIGSYLDSQLGVETGAAFVFRKVANEWVREATLVPDTCGPYDAFGNSVAINDKGNFIVVGAYMDTTHGVNAGAVYLFKKRDCRWGQHKKLFSLTQRPFEFFGHFVMVNGEGSVVVVESNKPEHNASNPRYTLFRKYFQDWSNTETFDQLEPTLVETLRGSINDPLSRID